MKTSSLIGIICFLVFSHHVICTVLYNAPANPLSKYYMGYVANYMEPLFAQKWLLFAPEPATNDVKLWYRCNYAGKWSSWQDPLQPILKKHQSWRLTHNAKLLYVYGNIPKDLNYKFGRLQELCTLPDTLDQACQNRALDSLLHTSEFELALRYVKKDLLHSHPKLKIDSLQLMTIQLYPKQFSERLSNKPFGFANPIELPPVHYAYTL